MNLTLEEEMKDKFKENIKHVEEGEQSGTNLTAIS